MNQIEFEFTKATIEVKLAGFSIGRTLDTHRRHTPERHRRESSERGNNRRRQTRRRRFRLYWRGGHMEIEPPMNGARIQLYYPPSSLRFGPMGFFCLLLNIC